MMPETVDREAVAARIRALLSKTPSRGASEAESLAAAEKARELMDKYRLTQTEIELSNEPITRREFASKYTRQYAPVDETRSAIATYTGTKYWTTHNNRTVFFGLKSDTEFAEYLYRMFDSAIDRATADWCIDQRRDFENTYDPNRAEKRSFQFGMAHRIRARLNELARQLDATATTGDGKSLVVVRGALVEDAFAKLNLKLGIKNVSRNYAANDAYARGTAAGNNVNLRRPIRNQVRGTLRSPTA